MEIKKELDRIHRNVIWVDTYYNNTSTKLHNAGILYGNLE